MRAVIVSLFAVCALALNGCSAPGEPHVERDPRGAEGVEAGPRTADAGARADARPARDADADRNASGREDASLDAALLVDAGRSPSVRDGALEASVDAGSDDMQPEEAGVVQDAARTDASTVDASPAPRATFRNPLNEEQGSDPWLQYHDGAYYLATTTWTSEITMRRATTIAGLKSAEPVVVWKGDDPGRCCNIWAPEFHLLEGPNGKRWYLYFSAGPAGTSTDHQRNHVLESAGEDPLGPYTYKARVFDPRNDLWAIDASVVTIGSRTYFLYSAWEGEDQGIYIAPMSNPWTLAGSRVRISRPTHGWETSLARVNEAPVALQRDGRTFVVYSASACWGPDYKLGMLTLVGSDPLQPSAWMKDPQPVFARADRARAFGPGHNGFFRSPDGTETWIVYHANASAEGTCDTKRTTRAQKIEWRADGTPDFGSPVALDQELPVPSGE